MGHIQVASSELKNERNIYYIITPLLTDRSLWGTSRLVCFFMQVSKKEKYGKLLSHKNNVKKTKWEWETSNYTNQITGLKCCCGDGRGGDAAVCTCPVDTVSNMHVEDNTLETWQMDLLKPCKSNASSSDR